MTTAGAHFDELIRIMRALRGPDGCPWDREQTLASLRPFLLEETYEALEALDRGDMPGLREELGDLLFEIVFLAHIAEEQGGFSIADAVDTVAQKLVRRHPHVFGDADKLALAEEVRGKWEELKAVERKDAGEPKTLLSGVPLALPALLRAYEYSSRAATVGFDWIAAGTCSTRSRKRCGRFARRWRGGSEQASQVGQIEEEVGDLLFAIANLARKLGVEPEAALRRANDKFRERFTAVETRVESRGERLQDKSLEELEAEWQAVKKG